VNRLGIDRLCHVGRGAFVAIRKARHHEFLLPVKQAENDFETSLDDDVSGNNLNQNVAKSLSVVFRVQPFLKKLSGNSL